eukprot:11163580-Lingulodinium_polyedra.AAC.1
MQRLMQRLAQTLTDDAADVVPSSISISIQNATTCNTSQQYGDCPQRQWSKSRWTTAATVTTAATSLFPPTATHPC